LALFLFGSIEINSFICLSIIMKLLATLSTCTVLVTSVFAADEPQSDLKVKGWIDLYYQYDLNHSSFGTHLTGREFDMKAGVFELANAELNMFYARKRLPFTFTLDLGLGRDVQVNNGLDGNNNHRNQIFQQAFISLPFSDGSTLDLGKFNTWIGPESVYIVDNPNYSLGTLYWYAQPNWHVGGRYSKPLGSSTSASFYVVNGWNETIDSNHHKTLGLSLSKTLSKKLSATLGYIGGKEGTNGIALPNPGESDVHMGDLIATYEVSDKHSLMLNADYASSKGANSGHWSGYSIYSNHHLSDTRDLNFRFSTVQDPQNLRGPATSISSLTGTYNLKTSEKTTWRMEARYDFANSSIFESSGSATRDNRTSLTLAYVVRF
jgi:hypothetical protein